MAIADTDTLNDEGRIGQAPANKYHNKPHIRWNSTNVTERWNERGEYDYILDDPKKPPPNLSNLADPPNSFRLWQTPSPRINPLDLRLRRGGAYSRGALSDQIEQHQSPLNVRPENFPPHRPLRLPDQRLAPQRSRTLFPRPAGEIKKWLNVQVKVEGAIQEIQRRLHNAPLGTQGLDKWKYIAYARWIQYWINGRTPCVRQPSKFRGSCC